MIFYDFLLTQTSSLGEKGAGGIQLGGTMCAREVCHRDPEGVQGAKPRKLLGFSYL